MMNAKTTDYGKWLKSLDWTYFATLTTEYLLTMKSARRLVDRFHKNLNKIVPTTIFWAAETFKVKDGHHIHCLIHTNGRLPYEMLIHSYQNATGKKETDKWNRIEAVPYNPKLNGTTYSSKDIWKADSDYDLLLPTKRQVSKKLPT